jgi:prophage maintenance system killer protein
MKRTVKSDAMVVYQAKSGAIELRGDFSRETVWATQAQMAKIFGTTSQNITIHLRRIYGDKELFEKATCKEFLQVQKEGSREIRRVQKHYNLDAIISVGYRINSRTGTKFRQWATKTLREHITKGYTIDRRRVATNYDAFMKSVADIRALLPEGVSFDLKNVLDLVREFAGTWVSLAAYDKDPLRVRNVTKKNVRLTGEELRDAIGTLRRELTRKGEASGIFALESGTGGIEGIVGNVMQSFGGKPVYGSLEEKAAHLLYFVVKNHPFADGNKRSGAFAFVWFLRRYGIKGGRNINPASLTALTLLVAESDPKKKDQMTALITRML